MHNFTIYTMPHRGKVEANAARKPKANELLTVTFLFVPPEEGQTSKARFSTALQLEPVEA